MNGTTGAHEVHVAGDRLDHHAGDRVAVLRERLLELRDVVVLEDERVLDDRLRNAGAGRVAEGRETRARLDEQRIGVAVVAALELDDHVAAGGAARQAQRAHRCLGPRADQAHLLDARHEGDDCLGELDLALGRCAEREAVVDRRVHGGLRPAGWRWPRIIGPHEPM